MDVVPGDPPLGSTAEDVLHNSPCHQENGDFLICPYKWLKSVVKAQNRCKSQARLTKLCLTGPVAEIRT